jgi:hypothetical protein
MISASLHVGKCSLDFVTSFREKTKRRLLVYGDPKPDQKALDRFSLFKILKCIGYRRNRLKKKLRVV